MRTSELVPVTFLVHPLIVATVKPLIEKLIRPDNEGEQYRALAAPWIECRFPPAPSYQGDIFRLAMIGPVKGEGADRSYSEADLNSETYALQPGAPMREVPITQLADMIATHTAERTVVECLHGHFFQLDLFSIDGGCAETSLVGGALRCGPDCIALDLDHARQLADRVRAAIDNCVAGSIIHRPACRDGGH